MALRGSATAQKILQISSRSFSSALTGNNGNSMDSSRVSQKGNLHITAKNQYPVAAALPLPNNIDPSESTRFSPQRNREISAASIVSHELNLAKTIDITVDNSKSYSAPTIAFNDPHLKSYDSNGAISMSAVMQTSVPNPFGGMHKFSHLNMPGGQWSQEGKFMSQSLHDSHYTNLRRDARSDWSSYDQNATVPKGTTSCHLLNSKNVNQFLTKSSLFGSLSNSNHSLLHVSSYSTQGKETASSEASAPPVILTKREQLKRAFKDYGATIVVFHVGISLISLECFYLLVSG
ncbi:FAM210B.2 family protein [Megaselia abdita]